jgi:SET domain-containing protein
MSKTACKPIVRKNGAGQQAARKTPRRHCRVGRSPTGLGLFATARIEKGAFIVEYKGRRITNAEAERLEARGARYMYELDSRWTIDGSSRRNIARYANHACRPNAESDVVEGRVILRAIETIAPGDEITYDYGREYFDIFLGPGGCKCAKCVARRRKKRAARRTESARG